MNYKRISFILGVLLLILMSACGPATATPTPVSGGCTQGGCPYPAICDLKSGVCTIYQTAQAPVAKANNLGNAGANAANNPGLGLLPPCTPDALPIPNVTSFCANQAAGLGGATVVGPGIVNDGLFVGVPGNWQCNFPTNDKFICSGPQNSKSQWLEYDACGFPNSYQSFGNYQCANGMFKYSDGHCGPDPKTGFQSFCTETSHYDTGLEACVDNVTGNPIPATDLCPPGYPYYLLDGYCLAQPYPGIVYNAQYTTVQLGECLIPHVIKQGSTPVCSSGYHWDATKNCCANIDGTCKR